jgi:hypothetical protein
MERIFYFYLLWFEQANDLTVAVSAAWGSTRAAIRKVAYLRRGFAGAEFAYVTDAGDVAHAGTPPSDSNFSHGAADDTTPPSRVEALFGRAAAPPPSARLDFAAPLNSDVFSLPLHTLPPPTAILSHLFAQADAGEKRGAAAVEVPSPPQSALPNAAAVEGGGVFSEPLDFDYSAFADLFLGGGGGAGAVTPATTPAKSKAAKSNWGGGGG